MRLGMKHKGEIIILPPDLTMDYMRGYMAEMFDGDPFNVGFCVICGGDVPCEPDTVAGTCCFSSCESDGVYGITELLDRVRKVRVSLT